MPVITELRELIKDGLKTITGISVFDGFGGSWDENVNFPGVAVDVERIDCDEISQNSQAYRARIVFDILGAVAGSNKSATLAALENLEEQILFALLAKLLWPEYVISVKWQGVSRNYAIDAKYFASSLLKFEITVDVSYDKLMESIINKIHVDVDAWSDKKIDAEWEVKL